MNDQKSVLGNFSADYQILKLKQTADWATARKHYRKLALVWHPDKFSDRPREKEHAQKQFIELTKAYKSLKKFQSVHKRLPFEHLEPEAARPDAILNGDAEGDDKPSRVDPNNLDMGTLARDADKIDERVVKRSPIKKILWSMVATVLVGVTIAFFFIQDQKASQKIIEAGRQVVKEAPPSEFMPTPAEIRRSESKGAFIRSGH